MILLVAFTVPHFDAPSRRARNVRPPPDRRVSDVFSHPLAGEDERLPCSYTPDVIDVRADSLPPEAT